MRLWSQIRADRVFKSGKRQMSSGGQLNNDPCKSRCSLCWQVDVLCVMSSWKFMYRFLPVEALRSKIYLIDQQHQILPVDTNTQELQLNKVTMQQTNARSNGVIIAWKLWLKQMQRKDKKKKKIGFLKKLNERWVRQYLEKAYVSNQNIRDKTIRFKDERNKDLELRL